jgi:hypothetical protein
MEMIWYGRRIKLPDVGCDDAGAAMFEARGAASQAGTPGRCASRGWPKAGDVCAGALVDNRSDRLPHRRLAAGVGEQRFRAERQLIEQLDCNGTGSKAPVLLTPNNVTCLEIAFACQVA